jgi:hypothetical protein
MVLAMLPITAFAVSVDYSAAASYITVDKTSVAADGAAKATITLVPRKADGTVITNTDDLGANDIWVKSTRDAETINAKDNAGVAYLLTPAALGSATGASLRTVKGSAIVPTADGEIKFELTSNVAGEAKISFYTKRADDTGKLLIGEATVTFTADAATIDKVNLATSNAAPAAGAEIELTARVLDASSNGIANQDVTFYVKKGTGSYAAIGTKTTDALGRAKLKYTVTEAGQFYYDARTAAKKYTDQVAAGLSVVYGALSPVKIEYITTASVFESGVGKVATFEVKLYDAYNNVNTTAAPTIDVITKPTGATAAVTLAGFTADNTYKFTVGTDKDGEYKVRATITGSGIFVEKTYTAQKKGDPVSIEVKLPKTKQSLKNTGNPTLDLDVKEVDAAGIKIAANAADYVVSSSNVGLVTTANNSFTVTGPNDDKKFGTATITVMHKTKNLYASVDVPIVGGPSALTATAKVTDLNAEVTLQLVDAQGNVTFFGGAADDDYTVFAGNLAITEQKSLDKDTGKGTLKLKAAAGGSYNVTIVTKNGIAKSFAVDFKAPAPPKTIQGAASVTMFVGARGFVADGVGKTADFAPFIENGRTFVPVRVIAESFGAVADWTPKNAAVEVVTLTRSDIQITINIGSYVINVVKDGVTSTVTTDVAAFIKDGRTVLPFRVIAEAFGAEVDYGPKDGPIEWVTFKQ